MTMTEVVLFVDDDAFVLCGLIRALRKQPYLLLTARNAAEGRLVLNTRPIDVIVCDESMPGGTGTELLAWVAQFYPQVVRLVLTGHAHLESALRAINQGRVYRYLTKPCHDLELCKAIDEALQERRRLRRSAATMAGSC
jgi:two-component system probable response regulator PhcQ